MSDQFLNADPTPSTGKGRQSFSGSPSMRSPSIPIPARKQKICRSSSFSAARRDSGLGCSCRDLDDSRRRLVPSLVLTPVSPGNDATKASAGGQPSDSPLSRPWISDDYILFSLPPSPVVTPPPSVRCRKSGVHLAPPRVDYGFDDEGSGDDEGFTLRVPSGSRRPTSPSILIPGKRRDIGEETDESESRGAIGFDHPSGDYLFDGIESELPDRNSRDHQFALSCSEDVDRRPVIFVPSVSSHRPSPLCGSLTSWHHSKSFLQSSSSPSTWPSSPVRDGDTIPTFSFRNDGPANEAVVTDDGETTGPHLRLAQSENDLLDHVPRNERRGSLPARFDAQHPMARQIGVQLCRIADEIEALFVAEGDGAVGSDAEAPPEAGAVDGVAARAVASPAAAASAPSAVRGMSTIARRISDWNDGRRVISESNAIARVPDA